MITALELTNFRGYQSLQLDLAPVTVVLGSNASGKSTLLSALAMLSHGADMIAHEARRQDQTRYTMSDGTLAGLADKFGGWREVFHRAGGSSADQLAVTGSYDNDSWVQKVSIFATAPGFPGAQKVELDTHFLPTGIGKAGLDASCLLLEHMSTLPFEETYLSNDEFEKAAQSGSTLNCIRNTLIRLDKESIKRLNLRLKSLAGAEISSLTPHQDAEHGAPLAVNFQSDGTTFEVGAANHGLVSALALLTNIEAGLSRSTTTGSRLLLLDEPEVHLNPRTQAAFAKHLVEAARAAKAQIVFVTHSDHIIRQLLPRSDCKIFNIEKRFSRLRRIYTQKDVLKALDATRDLAPYAAVNFLSSRKVLLVEGPTDETIIQRAAIAHFAKAQDRLSQFGNWTLLPLDGVDNAPAPGLIEKLFSSPLLPELKPSENMMVARIRDRDYDREPCLDIEKGVQVWRLEKVWSRHSIESVWLDEETLSALLLVALGPDVKDCIAELVKAAISDADVNVELLDSAADDLTECLRKSRLFEGKAAAVHARSRVRGDPKVWQHGKDRADFILCHIRSRLPLPLQKKVRSSIAKILQGIPTEDLGSIMVPSEIKTLLDKLVDL
jgi:predicted ATPase